MDSEGKRKFSYLYPAGESMVLMDDETFEQIELPVEALGDQSIFLTVRVSLCRHVPASHNDGQCDRRQDGVSVTVEYIDGKPLLVNLTEFQVPVKVVVRQPSSPPAYPLPHARAHKMCRRRAARRTTSRST